MSLSIQVQPIGLYNLVCFEIEFSVLLFNLIYISCLEWRNSLILNPCENWQSSEFLPFWTNLNKFRPIRTSLNNSRQVGTNTDKIVPIGKELNKMSELDQKEQTEKFDMRLSKWKKLSTRVYFANRQTVLKQYSNFKSFLLSSLLRCCLQ